MSAHSAPSRTFRPDIEGLRGVAILLVLAYHAALPGMGGGYIGVDVFFVLSGYLITGLLVQEVERTGRVRLTHFYARRARRLLPAAALVLVATLAVAYVVCSPIELRDVAGSARATALYVSNVRFALGSTNYLAADHPDPLLHTWSLAVEEQFYVVWPLLIVLALRIRGTSRASRARAMAVLAVLTAVSFALSVGLTRLAQPWAFFGSPARAWEFAIGGLAAMLPQHALAPLRPHRGLLGGIGLLLVIVAATTFDRSTPFPGAVALVPVLGAATLLVAGTWGAPGLIGQLLATRLMQGLGRISYALYLWHWPVLVFSQLRWGPLTLPMRLACVLVATALAALTLVVLENPVRFSRTLTPRPAVSLAMAAIVSALSFGVSHAARRAAVRAAATPMQRAFAKAHVDGPRIEGAGCSLGYLAVAPPSPCVFGDLASDTTVVLFGDSHAGQWFPAVEHVSLAKGWRLATMIKSECPTADVSLHITALNRTYHECTEWRAAMIRRIVAEHPALVVISNSNGYVVPAGDPEDASRVSAAHWGAAMRRTLATLDSAGVRVVVLTDTPRPRFDVPVCLSRAAWSALWRGSCTFARAGAFNTAAIDAERTAAAGLAHVAILDIDDHICPHASCEVQRGDTVLYRDSNHMTARFSAGLAPTLGAMLEATRVADSRRRLRRRRWDSGRRHND